MKKAGKRMILSALLVVSCIGVSYAATEYEIGDRVGASYHGQLGMSYDYNDSGWGSGLGMLEKWCALPNFNLAEQGQTAWEGSCGSCHIGASWSVSKPTANCSRCHQTIGGAEPTGPDEAPTVDKCMSCHSKDTAKRGDVFDAENDVHIAAEMNCQSCHPRISDGNSSHQIAKGTVIDTSEDTMEGSMDTCADCHGLTPHRHSVSHGGMLDKHCDEVACEVCHTGLRPGSALASRTWAEFTAAGAAGKPVTEKRGTDWLPDHKWYSSEDVTGHLPILGYTEMKDDPGAKIYAFNPVTVTWFINTSTSPLDDSIVVADVKDADTSGDNVTTVAEMRDYDGDGDGAKDYPNATLVTEDMNFQISHSVTAKEDAFICSDCHGGTGWVLDWTQLGYDADPRHKGKHR